jgi:large subunit ribosomal protein L15
MPLIRRLPKRGFHNPFKVPAQAVNVRDLTKVEGETVTPAVLADLGLVGSAGRPVKILGVGDVSRAYVVQGCAVSKTAREKIEQAGGRIEA